jgi:hypothetical protein
LVCDFPWSGRYGCKSKVGGRKENKIEVARGRSGKKNDQCHMEQKNSTFVRNIFGHERIEVQAIIDLMNDLYRNEYGG